MYFSQFCGMKHFLGPVCDVRPAINIVTPPHRLHKNLLKPYNYSDGKMFLRSCADENHLAQIRTQTPYGDNAFCNAVSALWNKLPKILCTSI